MEPTSQQELKQLLEEGKITEQEYQELLEAIRQKETTQRPVETTKYLKYHTSFGKAALILFILSIVLPIAAVVLALVLSVIGVRMFLFAPFLPISLICALLAFIFGIIGWKTAQGKIAAIGVPCLILVLVPGIILISAFCYRAVAVPTPIEISEPRHLVSHKSYPMDTLEGLLSQDMAEIDKEIFVNGGGSLRIKSDSPEKRTIRLYETGPMTIENSMLIYSAQMKSDLGHGKAYLEMWCDIPGIGEAFSRGLEQPIAGTTNWTSLQIPFRLECGQSPSNVKLNLIFEGTGTVWIDDIKLLSSPL